MTIISKKTQFPWLPIFAADFVAIVAAYYGTIFLRFHSDIGERIYGTLPRLLATEASGTLGAFHERFYLESGFRIILILTAVICMLYAVQDLYAGRRFLIEKPIAWNISLANVAALVIFYAYWYLERNVHHPRSMFASIIVINIVLCVVFRRLGSRVAKAIRNRSGIGTCRAVLVGDAEEATFIATLLEVLQPHGITCAKHLKQESTEAFEDRLQTILETIVSADAEMLIYADRNLSVPEIMQVLEKTDALGIPTKILSEELDVLVSRANLASDMIHGTPLVHFDAPANRGRLGLMRRAMTIAIATAAMVVLAPLLLVIGLLVRTTSKGPAIFVQERIGVNRKPFKMYKFRTMRDKAEELQAQIEEFNESEGALFKIKKDPRITPIGHFLRRFSLDELPQLVNVIRGDMVLVGPRPLPQRDFENYYEEWHYSRHGGLPGLTCLWQISGRSDIDFHNMCILDVYYLRNHTWIMDIKLTLRTFKVVLFGVGAY
jgi:exopolysaccharide biosynthesis polyprenyl glycosylphosphotransferase